MSVKKYHNLFTFIGFILIVLMRFVPNEAAKIVMVVVGLLLIIGGFIGNFHNFDVPRDSPKRWVAIIFKILSIASIIMLALTVLAFLWLAIRNIFHL